MPASLSCAAADAALSGAAGDAFCVDASMVRAHKPPMRAIANVTFRMRIGFSIPLSLDVPRCARC
jgi:hypothetical protein